MSELVGKGSKHSDQTRREAALCYLIHGSAARVGRSLGIPERTVQGWLTTEWWVQVTAQVRAEKEDEIAAGLGRIVDKAISETEDRLENGDAVFHQGEVKRIPMKGRDTALVGAIAIDKRQLILNKPTRITSSSEGMQDLLRQFEELARQSREKVVSDQ